MGGSTTKKPKNHNTVLMDEAISIIEKRFGKGSLISLAEYSNTHESEVISTGILSLDIALGIYGIPKGRIIEIFGPESSGKTTLALQIAAQVHNCNPESLVAYIDAEHAFDPVYAATIGVDINRLLISQPACGEDGLNMIEILSQTEHIDLIVVDSVAALVPKAEINGDLDNFLIGAQARMMSRALRALPSILAKNNTTTIFINQIREKINTSGGMFPGISEITPGGKALKFYSSVRLDIRKIASLKNQDNVDFGLRARIKVIKSKVSIPYKIAEIDMLFGKGISNEGCIIDLALTNELMNKRGAWYFYNKEQLGQGKEAIRLLLQQNPELANTIKNQVIEIIKNKKPA